MSKLPFDLDRTAFNRAIFDYAAGRLADVIATAGVSETFSDVNALDVVMMTRQSLHDLLVASMSAYYAELITKE